MNAASKRRGQRRSHRSLPGGRKSKIDISEFPKFLVRLAGWRWVWLARTEPRPRYRHD